MSTYVRPCRRCLGDGKHGTAPCPRIANGRCPRCYGHLEDRQCVQCHWPAQLPQNAPISTVAPAWDALAAILQRRRGEMGLTARQMAERAGIRVSNLVYYEHGKPMNRLDLLERVGQAYGISLGEMLTVLGYDVSERG